MNNEEWCKKSCPYYPDCSGGGVCNTVLSLLKEQEAEIRQLRLALDIAKGTCKGIAFETDEKFMGDL